MVRLTFAASDEEVALLDSERLIRREGGHILGLKGISPTELVALGSGNGFSVEVRASLVTKRRYMKARSCNL